MNNPLGYTDPSGYFSLSKALKNAWKSVWNSSVGRVAVTVAVAYFTGYYNGGIFGTAGLGATTTAAANTAAAGFAGSYVGSGGNFKAGLQGSFTALLFYGAGSFGSEGSLSRVAAHAAAGCIGASAGGGSCGNGALAAGFAEGIGGNLPFKTSDLAANLVTRTVIGGTASVLGGGKFENGAATGAFGYLFNSLAHPTNTLEAGVRQAILRGDVNELRLLLGEANLSASDMAIAQRALTTIETVGPENASMLAERYGVDWANRVHHIFEGAHQGTIGDALLSRFGSPAEAMAQIQRVVEATRPSTGFLSNTFKTSVNVEGISVQVRGRLIDGIYRIGTIEKW